MNRQTDGLMEGGRNVLIDGRMPLDG